MHLSRSTYDGITSVHRNGEMMMCRESVAYDEDSRDSGFADIDDEMPTSFSDIFNSQDNVTELDAKITELTFTKSSVTRTRSGLSDITNSNFESPKCRKNLIKFVKPFARVHSNFGHSRKRVIQDTKQDIKRNRLDSIIETEQSCVTQVSRRISMPRTHSSSVLERGQYAHVEDEVPKPLVINYHLPHLAVDSQAFRRIQASTLAEVMSSMSTETFDERYILIDCRYPYEYEGGHIKSAINIYDPDRCAELLYNPSNKKRIPIFYCEYSQKRGPSMAHSIRAFDRKKNMLSYPQLDHQEMYVLDKGYKHFYETHHTTDHKVFCDPCNYTTMDDCRYSQQLKQFTFHKKGTVGATSRKEFCTIRSRFRLQQQCDDSTISRTSQRKLFQQSENICETNSPVSVKLPPIPNPQFS